MEGGATFEECKYVRKNLQREVNPYNGENEIIALFRGNLKHDEEHI